LLFINIKTASNYHNHVFTSTAVLYGDFYNNTIPTILWKSERKKKLYEQFKNKLLVTFYTFGTSICFLRGEGMDVGGGGFEAKMGMFYSVTAVIICMSIRQMCVNETYVCVFVRMKL